jgi:hypothetical protein
LWLSNQAYSDGEAFSHAAADRSRNGVVGSIGKNKPIIPKASEMQPIMIKNILIAAAKLQIIIIFVEEIDKIRYSYGKNWYRLRPRRL